MSSEEKKFTQLNMKLNPKVAEDFRRLCEEEKRFPAKQFEIIFQEWVEYKYGYQTHSSKMKHAAEERRAFSKKK